MNEVMKDIYQVEIPLKGNPLKMVYSYIILGQRKTRAENVLLLTRDSIQNLAKMPFIQRLKT